MPSSLYDSDGIPKKISEFINPATGFVTKFVFDFEFATKEQLDILFFANYGDKNPAPIVSKMLSEVPTALELQSLATMVASVYTTKWNKLKALCKIEYDPIHNYRDELTESVKDVEVNSIIEDNESSTSSTNTINNDSTRTDNLSNTGSKTVNNSVTSSTDDGIYGFNSATSSNADTSDSLETENGTTATTSTNTGTQKNVEINSETVVEGRTSDNIKNINNSSDRTRTYTHEGNIGNLTTQQLMKQEIELWQWNFIQQVLEDLRDFLTIPIYLS